MTGLHDQLRGEIGDDAVESLFVAAALSDDPLGSALLGCAYMNEPAAALLLLDAGANTEFRGECRETPLLVAADGGYAGVVRVLLDAGADIDAVGEQSWDTPAVVTAQRFDYSDIVEMIETERRRRERDELDAATSGPAGRTTGRARL